MALGMSVAPFAGALTKTDGKRVAHLTTAATHPYIAASVVSRFTRLGRNFIAIGSDRRTPIIAGVNFKALLVGTFAFSGALAAL